MSIVSIAKCDDYTLEKVYHAIHRSLSLLNGTEMLVRPGKKVLLKLNLLSSSQTPERAVNTHPAVVRVLVDIFQKDFGCEVYIGDSSGSVKNSSTFNAFRVTRINEIAENTGAKIVNFDKDKYIDVYNKDYEILDKFRIARTLREVDFIVSVPKLKNARFNAVYRSDKKHARLDTGQWQKECPFNSAETNRLCQGVGGYLPNGAASSHHNGCNCRHGRKRP